MRFSLRVPRDKPTLSEARTPRKGFSLIEVIVTMLLLAIAVTSLATMSHSVSQSSIKVTGAAYRNGVLMHEVNRLIALPFDSLAVGSHSFSASSGAYPHTRVVTISQTAANRKNIKVILTPSNPQYKPDTLQFTRTNARTSRVLCTICA